MASSLSTLFLLLSLISPALSLTCSSQKFSNNKVFNQCVDLPTLNAYLHWTYTKSVLSIAYIAPPALSNGWIAWAINPTGKGMIGAQALLASKASNGSLTVQTYNITSYSGIVQSKIAFDVTDLTAEHSGEDFQIFATLALPEKLTTINQVWQAGGVVTNGMPAIHSFGPQNLQSTGMLNLISASTPSPVGAPHPSANSPSPSSSKAPSSPNSPAPGTAPAPTTTIPKNAGKKIEIGSSIVILLFFFLVSFY
ncbi:auxin-induced in root cultures protein 12-like [Impatiens glandulifera]|uniref:auxin-induced in root cultures protein 12-like n=1 Tax=Impatiens glandulifera TaxID=253017 RepID=UPI001FB09DD4|nr:auxin-induced in root cultures protein 12-like [Impatiens glandulifera]